MIPRSLLKSQGWELNLVRGLGSRSISKLLSAGITNLQQLASMDPQSLKSLGIPRPEFIIQQASRAQELLGSAAKLQDLISNAKLQLKNLRIISRRLTKLGSRLKFMDPVELRSELDQLDREINKSRYLEQQVDQLSQRNRELEQEFNSYKNLIQKQHQLELQNLKQQLIMDLIPVLDGIEDGLRLLGNQAPQQVIQGMRMIQSQLERALELHGLVKIQVEPFQQKYDPVQHQPLSFHPTGEYPEGTILEQYRAGYKLGSKIIRPALVKVAKRG